MGGQPSEPDETHPALVRTPDGPEISPTINGDAFEHPAAAPKEKAPSSLKGGDASFLDSDGAAAKAHHPHPRDNLAPWRWKAILVGGSIMAMINGYDVSNVANIQVPVYEAFGHIELLPWIPLAYSCVNVASVPLFRRLTGFMDFKVVNMMAILLVIVGSAMCGAASNINMVIAGRALIGMGAAGCYQIVLTYNVVFAYPSEIALTQALIGAAFAIGLLTGPIIGGGFAENEHATWRWAFYLVLPLCGIIVVAGLVLFPSYRVPSNKTLWQNLKSFDVVGCLLHMGTMVLLAVACIFSGPTWDWDSAVTGAIWVLLGAVFIAYIIQQRFCLFTSPENRIFPVAVVKNRAVALSAVGTACSAIGYGATLYYTPIYFAFTRGSDPLASAVRLLPFTGVFIFVLFLVGGLLPAVRYYVVFYLAGAILMLLGAGLQQTITPTSTEGTVMGLEALVGAGIGALWQLGLPISSVVLPPAQRLDAAALFNMAQLGGVAVSLSIAGSVYQNVGFHRIRVALADFDFSGADVRLLMAGAASPISATSEPAVMAAVVSAVTQTILYCFYLTVAAGAICFIAACCMKFEALELKKPASPKAVDAEAAKEGYSSVSAHAQ